MAGAGNQLTAMAAKHHAVPFVVLVGLQKLSPLFPHDPSVSFNDYKVNPLCILRAPRPTCSNRYLWAQLWQPNDMQCPLWY